MRTKYNQIVYIPGGHIAGPDGLRGIAVIGVILYHLFPYTVKGGFLGVSFFFVLSGYFLAITSEKRWEHGQFHVGSFYWKRICRIYPAMLCVVFVSVGVFWLAAPDVLNGMRPEIASILLGYNNLWQIAQNADYFTRIAFASPFTHMWTLSIELQFYLIWPALYLLYKRLEERGFRSIRMLVFVIPMGLSVFALEMLYHPWQDVTRIYYGSETRLFSLFMGAYVGLQDTNWRGARALGEAKRWKIICFAGMLGLTGLSFWLVDGQGRLTYRIWLVATTILFCEMLKLAVDPEQPIGEWLERKPLSWIGRHGYEIYLWQYPVIFLFQYLGWEHRTFSPVLIGIIVGILSAVLHCAVKFWQGGFREEMQTVKRVAIGIVSAAFCLVFALGVYGTVTAENTKQDSAKQLEQELKKNSEMLENQKGLGL